MSGNHRVEDLQRRIQRDPASILFAQLADEHLRLGEFEEAVRVCRAGLEFHPDYLSGHVALGRAFMELGQLEEAQEQFEYVLREAPDHFVALRSVRDLRQRREGLKSSAAHAPMAAALETMTPRADISTASAPDSALAELEGWLAAILADRR